MVISKTYKRFRIAKNEGTVGAVEKLAGIKSVGTSKGAKVSTGTAQHKRKTENLVDHGVKRARTEVENAFHSRAAAVASKLGSMGVAMATGGVL